MDPRQTASVNSTRLLSLDFLRGLIMVFLALEGSWLCEHLSVATGGTAAHALVGQFFHHPWHGLLGMIHTPPIYSSIIASLCIFGFEWWLCYFLYKKRIFFKL